MSRADIEAHIARTPIKGTPQEMRAAFDILAGTGPDGELQQRAGLQARVFGDGPDVLWLHGGGYVFGSPESHANCAATLARLAGRRVWVPAYRLAPEHRWPAQLHDAQRFLNSFDTPLPVIGDSAGGHLALNLALTNPEQIKALALISPNTDRSGRSTTRIAHSPLDLMNDDSDDARLAQMAMPDLPDDGPEASPLLADLSGLPPVWLSVSANEVLLDDTLLLIRKLALAHVPTQAEIIPDLFHMWTLWPDHIAQAAETISKISAFLRRNASEILP